MRREITFSYTHDDLIKLLELPKDSVIISMFTQTGCPNSRLFCFKISTDEKNLDKYLGKNRKKEEKTE